MPAKAPRRLIVAIYEVGGTQAEVAWRKLRAAGLGETTKIVGNTTVRLYQQWKIPSLEGEWVVALSSDASTHIALRTLRETGPSALFLLRETSLATHQRSNLSTRVLERLARCERIIEASREELSEAIRLDHALTSSEEWLLDNSYIALTQMAEIRRQIARKNPILFPTRATVDGYSRVQKIARELVEEGDYVIQANGISGALTEAQKDSPLSTAELWSFPTLLRLALVEALAELAALVSHKLHIREAAHFWGNRLTRATRRSAQAADRVFEEIVKDPLTKHLYFLASLSEQLQEDDPALARLRRWVQDDRGTLLEDLIRSEHNHEAAESLSIAHAFTSLRALAQIDFAEVFESVSAVEGELRADPSSIYPHSDFDTRDRCRQVIERLARTSGIEELEIARRAVSLARESTDPISQHVAYFLLDQGVSRLRAEVNASEPWRLRLVHTLRQFSTPVYICACTLFTVAFLALSLYFARDQGIYELAMLIILGTLAAFPLSDLAIQIVNALTISLLPPTTLPKMNFNAGLPEECATLVVVPMMLASKNVIEREIEKLEVRFLANQQPHLSFALFSDYLDWSSQTAAGDAALLQTAIDGIKGLNAKYSDAKFLLFHRVREWSQSEQQWIGRDRKRGKLEDLNDYLSGNLQSNILYAGVLEKPVRYVITLDADTQLPPGTATRLVATIAHPLNRVELDPLTKVRTRGYAIIQPRVSISLPGATTSRFTRIFADASGTDPYCKSVSDAQQDLFGNAIFHGKAIYDLEGFRTSLDSRFPAETILSHDLIEGAFAGVGLASDIELFEVMPADYTTFSRRQHRWIRGDWQIAEWILPWVPTARGKGWVRNPLSIINRWRIFDNLRRSLVPAASLLLLLFGWLISAAPGVWSLVLALAIAIPAVTPLMDRLARRMQGSVHGWQGAYEELLRALVMLAFLPHQAWIAADANSRALFRRWVSGRRLLEWQTQEGAERTAEGHLDATKRQLYIISGASLVLMLALALGHRLAPTTGFLFLWILAPALLHWLARTTPPRHRRELRPRDALYLRRLARQSWRYFDDLVNDASHWLPPDNSQLALNVEIAKRTSPTNIGLWLTSTLAARDMGYLTIDDVCLRCSNTLNTLERMERYEGHWLNWYETDTLQPLNPRYLSTVDSGNLLASFWILEQGFHDLQTSPIIRNQDLKGLADTLVILREVCGRDPSATVFLQALRRTLRGRVSGYRLIGRLRLAAISAKQLRDRRWDRDSTDERAYWSSRLVFQLESLLASVERYLEWMETLNRPTDSFLRSLGDDVVQLRRSAGRDVPSLASLAEREQGPIDVILARRAPDRSPKVAAWLEQLSGQYDRAQAHAAEQVRRLNALSDRASRMASEINMRLLYDGQRRLFGVGYEIGKPLEFPSHYDLLASECRLASFVSVAKGDVPIGHWFALGRPRALHEGHPTLLSWSGTMFEYLMPLLYMRTFSNSLLDCACQDAVRLQMEYGEKHQIPWGCSESAFSALDSRQVYQYRAFGVPTLALDRQTNDPLVVSPYSSMLALSVAPESAIENIERLERLGLVGPMGLYESIDFSREKKREGGRGVIVFTYMAHHQGMSFMAMDNVLHRDLMQRRFHENPRIRAIESLLFEGVPVSQPSIEEMEPAPSSAGASVSEAPANQSWDRETAIPAVQLQGNGNYSLMITNSGTGYSRWKGVDITRWRADRTLDPWGTFLYVRDLRANTLWSCSPRPVGTGGGTNAVHFASDRAEFKRRVNGIETTLEVTVSPEDDVELRRVSILNSTRHSRQIELTSYLELSLVPHAADQHHPGFIKLFVVTEYPEESVLIAHRRKRSSEEPDVWVAHVLVGATEGIQFETDRRQFLGRANISGFPQALRRDLSKTTGTVLDPIFSLRCVVSLEVRARVELCFLTMAANSRQALLALIAKYRRSENVNRAFEMAWNRSQLEFRHLGIGPATAHRFQELATHLVYPNAAMRASEARLLRNRLGQQTLWAYGISGDLPILTVTVVDLRGVRLVRELLLAHSYWRMRGFLADLVILDQEGPSYDRPLWHQLVRQMDAHSSQTGQNAQGGVFLREWHSIPEEHRDLILGCSHVVLSGSRGSLKNQLATISEVIDIPLFNPTAEEKSQPAQPLPEIDRNLFNGIGGFTPDGREYVIDLLENINTPLPWINVIAGPQFGTVVSESGLGFTWCGNSQTQRLTPWTNDLVSDPPSEIVYLRDDETGAVWTPTPLPIRESSPYRVRHGQGYSVFEHQSHGVGQELVVFVGMHKDGVCDPVKVFHLRLRNLSAATRLISATFCADLVLGTLRDDQQSRIQTKFDQQSGAVIASQFWRKGSGLAFAASSPSATSYTGDRAHFFGRQGSLSEPVALAFERLSNRTGAGLDPVAALQVSLSIPPHSDQNVWFFLGEATDEQQVRQLVAQFSEKNFAEQALASSVEWWDRTLGALQVRTPDASTNVLLNRWLLYQTLSCRFWARSATYQSSGAFGFRDQLQDCLAFLYAAPQLSREHILRAAARQFVEGDVQHWWHPETGEGVRTHCSDDLLWLPFAVAQYVSVTGDEAILDEPVSFIEGPPLDAHGEDKLFVPNTADRLAPLREHCRRAIDYAWKLGEHGLPLFGTGDWNDGMNRVGAQGRGESVWLGWFLCTVVRGFATYVPESALSWMAAVVNLEKALEQSAWDGSWYLRGFFDDGSPLGSGDNQEAKIDSIAQSWAVISGIAAADRARRALDSAEQLLVDEPNEMVRLLTPPFDHSAPHPGYIMGYPPGIRENGGQYTHGSLWLAMAHARMGDGDAAVRLLKMMSPAERGRSPERVARYQGEPYAVAADVYSASGLTGRSGWTWYTGSAGWMYRIWIEEVLGFHVRGNLLSILPTLPSDWPGYEMSYRFRSSTYHILVEQKILPDSSSESDRRVILLDGAVRDEPIALADDGRLHRIEVHLTKKATKESTPKSMLPIMKVAAKSVPVEESHQSSR